MLADGNPNDAYKPIEGDVKKLASSLKKQNKKEREEHRDEHGNLQGRFFGEPYIKEGNVLSEFARLSILPDDTNEAVAEKEKLFARLVSEANYLSARLLADTWCAVFVWKKDESDLGRLCPTENDFRRIENNPHSILPHVRSEVRRLARSVPVFSLASGVPGCVRVAGGSGEGGERADGVESRVRCGVGQSAVGIFRPHAS